MSETWREFNELPELHEEETPRYATIPHGASGSREGIRNYLPANYAVLGGGEDTTVIGGYDQHGWTLDDYVLPRLASGLYFGAELTDLPGWLRGILAERLGYELVF